MLCFLREKSHEMPGGQGYSAPAWAYPHLLIHYSVAEEFTEGVGNELACPGKGKTDLFSARSASLQHEAKRRAWVVPGSIGFLSTGRGGQDALTSGRKCVAPGRGLEVAGQTVRPSAEHGRPKVRLTWGRTSGVSCAVACHAESERQAHASWTTGGSRL